MTDHIRHDGDGTRAVQATPDAAQEHASIAEALRDPFAFSVALLGACGASPGKSKAPAPPAVTPERKPNQRKRRTAEDVLRRRDALARIGPLSGKTR